MNTPEFSVPPRVGRRTALRPIHPRDYDFLFQAASSPEMLIRWRFRGSTPSMESFVGMLWSDVLAQFIIESKETHEPVGFVSAYRPDFRNGTVYISVMVTELHTNAGWAMEAIFLFLDFLFRNWPLRKIFSESIEFNYDFFASGSGRLFTEEGRLTECEYYDGHYWSLIILSLTREHWQDWRKRLLPADVLSLT